jgi:sulfur carrier protein ThiS
MHRGSSKDGAEPNPPSGILPLSASPTTLVAIQFAIERAGRREEQGVLVLAGTSVRAALRQIGRAPEGCAVFADGRSVPLDMPLTRSAQLTVVPTFSGG